MEIGKVIHLQDKYPPNISDIELIKNLQNTGEIWLLVSGDHRITKNDAEKRALNVASNVNLILFQKALITALTPKKISRMYEKIDEIITIMRKPNPPKIIIIPINGRIKTI